MRKPRAEPDIRFVLHPEKDVAFEHFKDAAQHPFMGGAQAVGRRNAWWLAEAALLAYWPGAQATAILRTVDLEATPLDQDGVQGFVASGDTFVMVAFRGTQPDEPGDVLDDALFDLVAWDRPGMRVHRGFRAALDRVWGKVSASLQPLEDTRSVWFAGHSLGAALATLAADRYDRTAGVCTIGAPRVGDPAFARHFDLRFGARSLRYVNDADVVTHVPPPLPVPYAHVGQLRYIDHAGRISRNEPRLAHYLNELIGGVAHLRELVKLARNAQLRAVPDYLLDHMPRAYAVDIWNDYVDRQQPAF